MLQVAIRHTLEKLSNDEGEDLVIDDAWIEEAGEQFKATLRRQFRREKEDFRLRMSNIGRPLCQLQMAKSGVAPTRKPYNHIVRMIHGDIFECVMDVILKVAKVNITGAKTKVKLEVAGETIKGEDDIHIDDKVYDIKSSSPWAYDNKWSLGYEGLKKEDSFGYVGQIVGYAKAQDKEPGGWVVGNKSTGEIMVVEMDAPQHEIDRVMLKIEDTVKKVSTNVALERQFEPEMDTWRGKPTGRLRLNPKTCGFCDYVHKCWPNAEYAPHPDSTAKNPPSYWYLKD
jgi:hypothetical protein